MYLAPLGRPCSDGINRSVSYLLDTQSGDQPASQIVQIPVSASATDINAAVVAAVAAQLGCAASDVMLQGAFE